MAEIKSLLKEARKLIDEQNFKEAQECCKSILRIDKNNYLGLILLGKALEDTDQAPLAYQKAIASKPDHPLAWQGLANYYERKNESNFKLQLCKIYGEMLKLQLDDDKLQEIINKLGQLGCVLKSSDAVKALVNYKPSKSNNLIEDSIRTQLLTLLKADVPCASEDAPEVLNILDKILNDVPDCEIQIYYAKVCMQKSDFPSAANDILNLIFFSKNVLLREWFCKMLCTKFAEGNNFHGFDVKNSLEKIIEGIESSKYPGLLKSMISFDNSSYLDAYKTCVPLINYQQADVTEVTYILECTLKLKKWSVTQKLALNFITKCKDNGFICKLRKYLFLSLVKQQKWNEAITIVKNISIDNLNSFEISLLAECYIEVNENADSIMKILQNTEYFDELRALRLLKLNNYSEVIALLEQSDRCNPISFLYLGKAYWGLKDYDKCYLNLIKAAKLDSEQAETFLYLGHLYRNVRQDLQKCKKCYEKAYSLNSTNIEIVKNLSEIYNKLALYETNVELLNNAAKSIQANDNWICFRLGLNYLKIREWEKAIVNFRSVIKSDQENIIAFECLADAYYSRGSFTSALKVYNKIMLLNPNKTSHCMTRIGYIYSLLTEYDDAVASFLTVLEIEPFSVLALQGIAETWMRIARKKESSKLYGSAQDCAQNAINYICIALTKNNQYSCFWKLLADTLMFITKLPRKYSFVYMKPTFNYSGTEVMKRERIDIYPQAIACYSYITKRKAQSASYDLASAYLAYYRESKNLTYCNLSYNLALNHLKSKPTCWKNWNLLGKVCMFVQKFSKAQHCFIKGLLEARNWSEKVWCNLGTLYLKLKLYKLANYCFWRGQSTLPSYPISWIGQALIAEVLREDEAMDLYRHATLLNFHPESALGYADWVCRSLQKSYVAPELKYAIEGLYAVEHAIDLLEWYCHFEPNHAVACNMLGILQEKAGLLSASCKSYEKALLNIDEDNKNAVLLNVGRTYIRMEKYDDAIISYKSVTEASLNSTSGLALALYKKGSYEEAYSAYDTALHWLSNEENEKADLLVAMAGIVYKFKGPDDAKTLLFHSIQISQKKPTAHSLFAICSFGLIHTDESLYKLALNELQKYQTEPCYGFDIGFLKSYLHLREDDIDQAIKILCSSLHNHPSDPLLLFNLAQYCLRSNVSKAKTKASSCCAQKALFSISYNDRKCNPAKMLATASIAEYMFGNIVNASQLAKKGLHMFVDQADVWAALLFTVLSVPGLEWNKRNNWIQSAVANMRRRLNISRPLSRWVGLIERKLGK